MIGPKLKFSWTENFLVWEMKIKCIKALYELKAQNYLSALYSSKYIIRCNIEW